MEYQYPQGSDDWVDPFDAEVSDNNRPQPSPRADFGGAKRPLWQTYAYDWLGNTLGTDDDAHAFYDRSLGTVTNDGYRIAGADNSTKGGARTGNLSASYDASGNLVAMDVHREADCIPADKCTNQHFEYEWDEVGRLVRARRFDMANPPSGTPPDADLSYTYDASDNRVLKTVGDHYTAYIFGSLELRSTTFDGDYVVTPEAETTYLQAHGVRLARVVHSVPDPYQLSTTRVFLELGDQLGSTSVVLDLASGELVERSTAYAYGATESDYRADRWGKFREDYRFTGKEEDIEVGLQYFGKRFYAPLLQRWISPDPLAVHAPGQADLNLYAYVHGRVLVAVDPVGLQERVNGASGGPPAPNVAPAGPNPDTDSVDETELMSTASDADIGVCTAGREMAGNAVAPATDVLEGAANVSKDNGVSLAQAGGRWLGMNFALANPVGMTVAAGYGIYSGARDVLHHVPEMESSYRMGDMEGVYYHGTYAGVGAAQVTLTVTPILVEGAPIPANRLSLGNFLADNEGGVNLLAPAIGEDLASQPRPLQLHHFATNKSESYTAAMGAIAERYGLELDEPWNTELMSHQGRHPNEYHQFVLGGMKEADNAAGGDFVRFLEEYEVRVKDPVRQNPEMLRKSWWRK